MTKHVKPTTEELEANAQKAAEELEAMDKGEEKKEEETPEEKPQEKPEVKEEKKVEVKEEIKEEPDYKKKFIDSSRESIILHEKNKKTNEAIEKAMQASEPTDEELVKKYPDWEMMSEFEKKMAKDSEINSRRFSALGDITKENKNVEGWNKKVDDFVEDPKVLIDNPDLEGKQDEFRLFATKPTRRNVDFDTLTKAFLYEESLSKPKNKGKMFEVGSGGPDDKGKPKSDKISIDEARQLRNTDYNKYKSLLKAGKIDTESI